LASLEKLDYPKEHMEIIVWDNASTDGSQHRLKEALEGMMPSGWGGLRLIEHEENFGIYPARDRAFRLRDVQASYILSIDDDVELAGDCLREMLAVFESRPMTGVVGARVVYYDLPERVQSAAHYLNRMTGRYTHAEPRNVEACDFVIGCGALIKAEAFDAVGGFDDTYFMSHGEVDFCLKVKEKGYQVYYAPGALIKHRVSPDGRRYSERLYYLYRNKAHVLRRHTRGLGRVIAMGGYLVLGFPKACLDAVRYHGGFRNIEWKVIGLAFWDGLRGYAGRRFLH
jgi:GT2 family glycosyltransferase